MNTIKKIVLTGGPCAGKTTALVKIIDHFSGLGYKVFTIPEVPTMFTQAGMNYLTKNEKFFFEGEKATFLTQIGLEDSFTKMAETIDKPVIIVCDRGTMDISTYLTEDFWNRIISEQGYTNTQLRERYDAVLHLVSAADGAEQFYTTANNAQRVEKADEKGLQIARELDKKIVSVWKGHPHLRVINNHEDFNNKLNRVLKEISNVLGIPQPIEEERKYIVKLTGEVPNAIDSDIVQTYLSGEPGSEIRLRRRGFEGGKYVYVHTTKKRVADNEQVETERQISANLYENMLQQADPYRQRIHKHRKSFIWKGHPHLRVINNHEDFNNKLNRVLKEISNVLGIPQPIEEERKYIVKLTGEVPNAIDSDIVQTYLSGEPGSEIRLRRRGFEGGKYVYVHTTKKRVADNEQIETERQISANLYENMLQQADPYRATIRKHRKSFIWKGQYFELDSFSEPVKDLMILETKGIAKRESVKFPPFIQVLEDITGNTHYYNYNIALKR